MKAHPGEWLVWHRKRQPPPRYMHRACYERLYRTENGVTTLYMRLRPLPENFVE